MSLVKFFAIFLTVFLCGCAGVNYGGAKLAKTAEQIKIYPEPKPEQDRLVLNLKPLKNEKDYFLLIKFGKDLELDCNNYFLGGAKLSRQVVKGWGYNYYELEVKDEILAGTKMACLNQNSTARFVAYHMGDDLMLAYNSKLPLVFYVPKGVEVKYQIFVKMKEGILK